jgi:uncharacterized protein
LFIVYKLKPYSNNITNGTVKTPKLYFLDTGLVVYLTRWNTADVLKTGAKAGAFFETFILAEIIMSHYNRGILDLPMYFYYAKNMNGIYLLIEVNRLLYLLDIKKHTDPQKNIFPLLLCLAFQLNDSSVIEVCK